MQTMYEELVQNATLADFDQISLGPSTAGSTANLFFDDMVVSCHNEAWNFPFLHYDYRIAPMHLTAVGTDIAWTNDWQSIEEIPTNVADYIDSTAVGTNIAETSNMEAASVAGITGTPLAVRGMNINWEVSSTSTLASQVRFRNGADITDTTAVDTGSTTVQEFVSILNDVPGSSTALWSLSVLDSLEIGVIKTTDTSQIRCGASVVQVLFVPAATITVSGTCNNYNQTDVCVDGGGDSVAVAINGVLQGQSDATVDDSWSIASVAKPQKGDTVTVFINGAATAADRAVAVTKYDGSGDITDVTLFKEHLTIGSVDNQTISSHEMSYYDNSVSGDADVFFDIDAGDLIVDDTSFSSQEELYICTGDTFRPSADVTTNNIEIVGTLTANGNTINVSGSWANNGTFTQATSTVNFNGSTSQTIGGSAATTFNNITVAASAIVTTSSNSTINKTFTVNSLGSFSAFGGTITMATTGWTISNLGTLAFSGLTISETPSSQSSASYTINGALTVALDKTLAPTSGTITMGGGEWEYRKSITLSRASGAVTNYPMQILVGESSGAVGEDVDCGGYVQSDFDDLRFTNSSGTLLDYWIESISGIMPNQLATVWVEFDSIGTGATTFYMYYGNASATTVSNAPNTFPFFDRL